MADLGAVCITGEPNMYKVDSLAKTVIHESNLILFSYSDSFPGYLKLNMAKTQYSHKLVILSLLLISVISTNFQSVSHAQNLAVIFDLCFTTCIQLACQVYSTSEILCLLK